MRREGQRSRDKTCGRKWEVAQGRNQGQETKKIGKPGEKVTDISFNSDSAMEVETEKGTPMQTEEFDSLFHASNAKPQFNESYFAHDNEKVKIYTGLPAYVLPTVLQFY